MARAIDTIRAEHEALDQVLSAMESALDELTGARSKPNLDLLYSAVYYIRVFPERQHHPKEEAFLFKALRRRRPESAPLLEELESQHQEGAALILALEEALKAFDADYPEGLPRLREAAARFIAFQRRHIGQEEREVIPLARVALTSEDWRAIDLAFAGNSDPLFGENLATGFRALHDRITRR